MVDAQRPWKGPILDNHFHLNRNGRFLDAAKDFKNVGGTHLVLVHCPDFSSPPTSLSEHRRTYADTIAMANEVRKEHDLHVRVVLGQHGREDRVLFEPHSPYQWCQHTFLYARSTRSEAKRNQDNERERDAYHQRS